MRRQRRRREARLRRASTDEPMSCPVSEAKYPGEPLTLARTARFALDAMVDDRVVEGGAFELQTTPIDAEATEAVNPSRASIDLLLLSCLYIDVLSRWPGTARLRHSRDIHACRRRISQGSKPSSRHGRGRRQTNRFMPERLYDIGMSGPELSDPLFSVPGRY